MFQYCFPIRELRTAKVNPFPSEMICAVRRTVVNEVGPFQETLVMAEDKPLFTNQPFSDNDNLILL